MRKLHACPRCGSEFGCSTSDWPDRHPAAAVTAGLLTLVFMGMMFSVYPIAATTMTVLAGVWLTVRAAATERRRRAALAARADYEHAALMARSMSQPIRLPASRAHARRTPVDVMQQSTAPQHSVRSYR